MSQASATIQRIGFMRVRTGRDMQALIRAVRTASQIEGSKRLGKAAGQLLDLLERQAGRVPAARAATMAPFFGKLRDAAASVGAARTAAAVVMAAQWFHREVELPGAAKGLRIGRGAPGRFEETFTSLLPSSFQPSGGAPPELPPSGQPAPSSSVTEEVWFWPAVVLGVGAIAVGVVLSQR